METIRKYWREWRIGFWLLGAGSAVLVAVTLLFLSAYLAPASWSGTRVVRDVLPLPVALVGGRSVGTYAEVADDLAALRTFYESQDFSSLGLRVDFSTPEGQDRLRIREREIVDKMIEDTVVRSLAEAEGITFTKDDALRSIAEKAVGNDAEETAQRNVARLYGWSLEKFAENVVLPDMYSQALEERFSGDRSRFAESEAKIAEAHRMLFDSRSFAEVSVSVSDGRTAEDGGAMGWFAYDQLVGPLQAPAKTQAVGVPGDVIESPLGFHILLVNERKSDDSGELVNLSQIFVKKETFGEWLTERLREADVRVLSPEYEWDGENAAVRFRDERLRQVEQDILRKSEGDASVML